MRPLPVLALLIIGMGPASAGTGSAEPKGAQLFSRECGICHNEAGFGTMMLERRLGKERSLLRKRSDLLPVYIKTVVRRGLSSMPPLSRVEISDPDLDAIIVYLTRPQAARRHE